MKNKGRKFINRISLAAAALIIILAAVLLCLRLSGSKGSGSRSTGADNITSESDVKDEEASEIAAAATTDPVSGLIRQLISSMANDPDAVSSLLSQLSSADPDAGSTWKKIIAYWNEVNEPGFTGGDLLPAGLPEDDSLCIVVMGFALNSDGTMRDDLALRLAAALKCAAQYPNSYILVTGGGTALNNKEATEADVMAQWLEENGISENRIIIENKSLTTAENAVFSQRILSGSYPQIKNIAIVTSDYHVPLSCLLFNTQFILADAASGSETEGPRVTANACCIPMVSYEFDMEDQANWMNTLFSLNP